MNRMIDKTRRQLKRKAHIRKKISGTPERPRMTVFRSNLHMYVQVIDDTCGKTLVSASTVEADLRNLRNNCEDALKLGEVVGKRILDANIESVVFTGTDIFIMASSSQLLMVREKQALSSRSGYGKV